MRPEAGQVISSRSQSSEHVCRNVVHLGSSHAELSGCMDQSSPPLAMTTDRSSTSAGTCMRTCVDSSLKFTRELTSLVVTSMQRRFSSCRVDVTDVAPAAQSTEQTRRTAILTSRTHLGSCLIKSGLQGITMTKQDFSGRQWRHAKIDF